MDCSLLGSSVHGILQARILEWVAISFSRGSSWSRNQTQVSSIAGRFFTNWAMREAPPNGKDQEKLGLALVGRALLSFSSSHVWMWGLDYKESWAWKNWCFWTVVLEKTLESPLGCKEIKGVSPKWNQSWILTERADAEAETPVLWPPDVKDWLLRKDSNAGKNWRQEEKGMT